MPVPTMTAEIIIVIEMCGINTINLMIVLATTITTSFFLTIGNAIDLLKLYI